MDKISIYLLNFVSTITRLPSSDVKAADKQSRGHKFEPPSDHNLYPHWHTTLCLFALHLLPFQNGKVVNMLVTYRDG